MSINHGGGHRLPTRFDAVKFRVKSVLLQAKRAAADLTSRSVRRHSVGSTLTEKDIVAESKTRLWTETGAEERFLVAGKIQNLRIAARRLNGIEIPSDQTFSFWQHVGRATRGRGYVPGRELREGCIIPNVGGGLCQLSNALYDAALKANFDIVERHAHTQVIAGSLAERGRDATVFWNYVDLRFRSPEPFRIETKLTSDHLVVSFRGTPVQRPVLHRLTRNDAGISDVNSCASCGMDDCFRSLKPDANIDFGSTAYLVDESSPEFAEYISSQRSDADTLMLPIDGKRFNRTAYAWPTSGFASVKQSMLITAVRSYRSRKLAAQGAARQRNLLDMSERLAASYAAKLSHEHLHVVVQQDLLPFLWQEGALGGRTFDVLMNALPMSGLQASLDRARELHPESTTLGDFRADPSLVDAENAALAAARKIITPHSAIARTFPDKAELLKWKTPPKLSVRRSRTGKPFVVFPASTLGRKGCYELREAISGSDIKLITLGPYIEDPNFWKDLDVEKGGDDWLEKADVVVLPAFVEHRPRRLIAAAAMGIPVIASYECGVENIAGITSIGAGNVDVLRERLTEAINAVRS